MFEEGLEKFISGLERFEPQLDIMLDVLIDLISMSIQASLVIGIVLIIRFLFQRCKIAKKYMMLLWIVPFLCLILPWRISSPVGVWQEPITEMNYRDVAHFITGISEEDSFVVNLPNDDTDEDVVGNHSIPNNDVSDDKLSAGTGDITDNNVLENNGLNQNTSEDKLSEEQGGIKEERPFLDKVEDEEKEETSGVHVIWEETDNSEVMMRQMQFLGLLVGLCLIWSVVVVILYAYSFGNLFFLSRKLRKRIVIRDNIYMVDDIPVPMVVGVFAPKIYIPSGINEAHLEYVIAHEETHIRRKDTLTKVLAYFITCIHWFNPLAWIAYNLMVKDMEMACDEETIARIGGEKKAEYATALLQLSTGMRNVFAVPLAFGEGSTKDRIKNVLSYEKTKTILAVAAIVVGLVVAILFLTTNGKTSVSEAGEESETTEMSEAVEGTETEDVEGTEIEEVVSNMKKPMITYQELCDAITTNTIHTLEYDKYKYILEAPEVPSKKIRSYVIDMEESLCYLRVCYDNAASYGPVGADEITRIYLYTPGTEATLYLFDDEQVIQQTIEDIENYFVADNARNELRKKIGITWNELIWLEENVYSDLSNWYEDYCGAVLQRNSYPNEAHLGPAIRSDIIYYQTTETNLQLVLNKMAEAILDPLMKESEDRAYTILKYRLDEHKMHQLTENVWYIEFINGYYAYEGTEFVSWESAIDEITPDADGLIPFNRNGTEGVFAYILIREGDVYRLQRFNDMKNIDYDKEMVSETVIDLNIPDEELTPMQRVILNREAFYGKVEFSDDNPATWHLVEDCAGLCDYSGLNYNSFYVIDMDQDGKDEVCLSYRGYILILREQEDGVYGYNWAFRSFNPPHTNGTFHGSSGAAYSTFYGNVSFAGNVFSHDVITSVTYEYGGDNESEPHYYKDGESYSNGIEISKEEYDEIMSVYASEEAKEYALTYTNILKYVP